MPFCQIPSMTQPLIEIRQAVSAHVETVFDFNIALCKETEEHDLDRVTVSEGVRRFVSEPARGPYFVPLIAGEVVGQTAHTFEKERLEKGRDLLDSGCLRASTPSQSWCLPRPV